MFGDVPLLVIPVVILVLLTIAYLLYRKGTRCGVVIYNHTLAKWYTFWPKYPYTRTTVVVGVVATLVALVFVPVTDDLIVNVTAFYATILLLQEPFTKEEPLLTVTASETYGQTAASASDFIADSKSGEVINITLEIENYGGRQATDPQVQFRIHGTREKWKDWVNYENYRSKIGEIGMRDPKKIKIPIDVIPEEQSSPENLSDYLIEIKVIPSRPKGYLKTKKIIDGKNISQHKN